MTLLAPEDAWFLSALWIPKSQCQLTRVVVKSKSCPCVSPGLKNMFSYGTNIVIRAEKNPWKAESTWTRSQRILKVVTFKNKSGELGSLSMLSVQDLHKLGPSTFHHEWRESPRGPLLPERWLAVNACWWGCRSLRWCSHTEVAHDPSMLSG